MGSNGLLLFPSELEFSCNAEEESEGAITAKCSSILNISKLESVDNKPENILATERLKAKLVQHLGPLDWLLEEDTKIDISLEIKKGEEATGRFRMHGKILEEIFNLCNGKVEAEFNLYYEKENFIGGNFMAMKFAKKEGLDDQAYFQQYDGISNWASYEPLYNKLLETGSAPVGNVVVLWVTLPEVVEDFPRDNFRVVRGILSDRIFSDVEIIAKSGEHFPCHRAFLAVSSPVLYELLENSREEPQPIQIPFDVEIDDESVTAFLDYLYTLSVQKPSQKAKVAVDLLQAGHKYDIYDMMTDMKEILLNRPHQWFEVDAALKLFLFSRNVEDFGEITKKATAVLKLKTDVGETEEFKNLVESCPEASSEAIAELTLAMASLE